MIFSEYDRYNMLKKALHYAGFEVNCIEKQGKRTVFTILRSNSGESVHQSESSISHAVGPVPKRIRGNLATSLGVWD